MEMCIDVREVEMGSGSGEDRKEALKERRREGGYQNTCDVKVKVGILHMEDLREE